MRFLGFHQECRPLRLWEPYEGQNVCVRWSVQLLPGRESVVTERKALTKDKHLY
jgi:hypothetical protein